MENATKALTMAGGVLIAIMVIAALIYASGTFQVIPKAQDESAETRQLTLFNQQYESYARDALYGTDLISILNKARDNNERYDLTNPEERMYIEIEFTLLNDVEETTKEYKEYLSGSNKGKIEEIEGSDKASSKTVMKADKIYKLSELTQLSESNEMRKFFDKLLDFNNNTEFNRKEDKQTGSFVENGVRYRTFTRKIPDTSEFKTRIFKCTIYKHDSEGRINYMKFEEQRQDKTEEETT